MLHSVESGNRNFRRKYGSIGCWLRLEGFGEELAHQLLDFRGLETIAMTTAFDDVERGFDPGRLQGSVESLALLYGNHGIGVSVDYEHRRVARRNVG